MKIQCINCNRMVSSDKMTMVYEVPIQKYLGYCDKCYKENKNLKNKQEDKDAISGTESSQKTTESFGDKVKKTMEEIRDQFSSMTNTECEI